MKKTLVFIVLIVFVGCQTSGKPKKPDNLIPKDEMVNILYDVFILNAAKGANKTVLEKNGIFPQDFIFEKYKIDSLQFALSNEYYGFHTEDYESIIARIEQRIKNKKEIYSSILEKEEQEKRRIRDSIKALSDSVNKTKSNKKSIQAQKPRVDYKDYIDESSK